MNKNLTLIPLAQSHITKKDAFEWTIPETASVALTYINDFGYTFMARVKVEKKHFWSPAWKTFTVNDVIPDLALMKGVRMLEDYGYTINTANIVFENLTR